METIPSTPMDQGNGNYHVPDLLTLRIGERKRNYRIRFLDAENILALHEADSPAPAGPSVRFIYLFSRRYSGSQLFLDLPF